MRNRHKGQKGVILLLSLVALLLISTVAMAILYIATAESGLMGYQRAALRSYDGGLAGIEEGRSRLSAGDPMFLGNWASGNVDFPNPEYTGGVGVGVGQVLYILNPAAGEVVTPWMPGNPYYDWEYVLEFGTNVEALAPCPGNPIAIAPNAPPAALVGPCGWAINSDLLDPASLLAGLAPQGPYKWARITLLTERMANRDIDASGAPLDNNIPVNWVGNWDPGVFNTLFPGPLPAGVTLASVANKMNIIVDPRLDTLLGDNDGQVEFKERVGRPVYRITAMAGVASGGTRVVQYDVSTVGISLEFPGAVSIIGTNSSCGNTMAPSGADISALTDDTNSGGWGPSNILSTLGADQAATPDGDRPALAFTDPNSGQDCFDQMASAAGPNGHLDNWTGPGGGFDTNSGDGLSTGAVLGARYGDLTTLAGLTILSNNIRSVADQTFAAADPPPNSDTDPANDFVDPTTIDFGFCAADGSVTEPKITVIDGDMTINGTLSGCGVLLVTGELSTAGNVPKWNGVILLIGEGQLNIGGGGAGYIDGSLLMARIYCDEDDRPGRPNADTKCNGAFPAAPFEPDRSRLRFSGGGSLQFRYNSFWISKVANSSPYGILAFRELAPN